MASRVHYTKRSIESQAVSALLCSTDSAMLVETDPLSGELGEWEADDASVPVEEKAAGVRNELVTVSV